MNGNNRFARTSLWLVAGIFVLATSGTVWAQSSSSPKRTKVEPWLEAPGATALAKGAGAEDRAVGRVNVSQFDQRTHNFGDMGTTAEGWHCCRYPRPDGSGSLDSYGWNQSMALAVGPGSWLSTPQVHESTGDFQSLSLADWESQDGARGAQFSNPPQTWSGYPMFATSDLPGTWPPAGWPAPETVTDIWIGTDEWNKWERRADKEIYCEFDDTGAARNPYSSVLDITVRKRVLGYGSLDGVFFQFELTNNSSNTYTGCFIGQFGDLGSPTYSSWIGFPRADFTRSMTYNIGDAYDASAGTHRNDGGSLVPFFGFVMLESPTGSYKTDDTGAYVDTPDLTMGRLALTHWEDAVYDIDEELYGALTGYTQYLPIAQAQVIWKADATGSNPVLLQDEDDWASVYNAADADHYQYRASGEFTFAPGEKINYVVAHVAGGTESALLATADKAMRFYQAQFQTSGPPPSPELTVPGLLAGPHGLEYNPDVHSYRMYYTDSVFDEDGEMRGITMTWDGSASETEPDAITNNVEFQGYKIYKSSNRGASWGEVVTDSQGNQVGYVPAAQFDIVDDVKGDYLGVYIGDDTGIVHSWTDTDVLDGFEYWYAITSYDYAPPEPMYESARGGDPTTPNVVSVIAGARPAGYLAGAFVGDVTALTPVTGLDYGTVSVGLVDASSTEDATYTVTIEQGATYGDDSDTNLLGVTLTKGASTVLYSALLPEDAVLGTDLLPVADGFRVMVETVWNTTTGADRNLGVTLPTGLEGVSGGYYAGIFADDFYGGLDPNDYDDAVRMFTCEVRFDTVNTQYAYAYEYNSPRVFSSYRDVPFTAWDVTSSPARQINVAYRAENGSVDDEFVITDDLYGRHYVYLLSSSYSGDATPDAIYTTGSMAEFGYGDTEQMDGVWATWWIMSSATGRVQDLHGTTALMEWDHTFMRAGNTYTFSTTAPAFEDTLIDYDDIQVVPNPYYVLAEWDRNVNRRKIMFTHVPQNCTVDIYTLSGELVASLDHSGSALDPVGTRGYNSDRVGTVVWNIWTYEYTEAAFGLYIYVVKVGDDVKKVGKFAVIR